MQKKTVQDNDIRSQSFSGVKWASIGHFSSQGISFVLGLVLARLLLPSDYGILGMLFSFDKVHHRFQRIMIFNGEKRKQTDIIQNGSHCRMLNWKLANMLIYS